MHLSLFLNGFWKTVLWLLHMITTDKEYSYLFHIYYRVEKEDDIFTMVQPVPGMHDLVSDLHAHIQYNVNMCMCSVLLKSWCYILDFFFKLITVLKSGKVQIRDTLQGTVLCEPVFPSSHELMTPWDPVVAVGGMGQLLFLKGALADEMFLPFFSMQEF